MCTLIALWRAVPGYDLVIGMNRDESAARPADPPAVFDGDPRVVAPRDRKAGGTWLAASGTGLIVALSNHRGRTSSTARSRGLLVLDVARQKNVGAADIFLQRTVREHEYNFWNLMVASRLDIRFVRFDGTLLIGQGHEGLNVMTNEGANLSTDPKAQTVGPLLTKAGWTSIEDAIRALQSTLRTHASAPDVAALCIHGAGGGTVSSTILGINNADPGENVLLYADGAPCATPYRDYHEAIRRLPSPG
jgi:uncharacterized protein with NRDE domain